MHLDLDTFYSLAVSAHWYSEDGEAVLLLAMAQTVLGSLQQSWQHTLQSRPGHEPMFMHSCPLCL